MEPITTSPAPSPAPKWGVDQVLIFATLIAIIPYSIDITIQKRKIRRKEELYTEFLFKLSELMRGGLDPIKAVKELSKTDLGDLSPHVKMAATALTFGKSFEEAMKRMAISLHSEIIKRYTCARSPGLLQRGVSFRSYPQIFRGYEKHNRDRA